MRREQNNLAGREGFNETNDCTVCAISAAAEVPYAEAHAFLAAHGRRPRRGMYFGEFMRGRTELLGWKVIEEQPLALTGGRTYPTLARVAAHFRKGRYIVRKRGHAFAIVNGTVIDSSRMGGRARVVQMWRLERVEVPKPEPTPVPAAPAPTAVPAPVVPAPAAPMPFAVKRYVELRAAGELEAAAKLFNNVTAKIQQAMLAAVK